MNSDRFQSEASTPKVDTKKVVKILLEIKGLNE